jgi:hypothetical protein
VLKLESSDENICIKTEKGIEKFLEIMKSEITRFLNTNHLLDQGVFVSYKVESMYSSEVEEKEK